VIESVACRLIQYSLDGYGAGYVLNASLCCNLSLLLGYDLPVFLAEGNTLSGRCAVMALVRFAIWGIHGCSPDKLDKKLKTNEGYQKPPYCWLREIDSEGGLILGRPRATKPAE
jgi:hypothetical protein